MYNNVDKLIKLVSSLHKNELYVSTCSYAVQWWYVHLSILCLNLLLSSPFMNNTWDENHMIHLHT